MNKIDNDEQKGRQVFKEKIGVTQKLTDQTMMIKKGRQFFPGKNRGDTHSCRRG